MCACSDPVFDNAAACQRPEDPYLGEVLSSMLRILYAQAALVRDAVSVHASCVSLEGRGYLFLGRSGTGKSTHARRWLEAFPGCHLLNDDNPVLRVEDGTVTAYGTPWSGKTPCYRNEYAPVAGIVRRNSPRRTGSPRSAAPRPSPPCCPPVPLSAGTRGCRTRSTTPWCGWPGWCPSDGSNACPTRRPHGSVLKN